MTNLHQTQMRENLISLDQRVNSSACNTMSRAVLWPKLENIVEEEEEGGEGLRNWTSGAERGANAPPHQPETPTESMEFLGRSWSVSAGELSKALSSDNNNTAFHLHGSVLLSSLAPTYNEEEGEGGEEEGEEDSISMASSRDSLLPHLQRKSSPPISPRTGGEMMHLYKSVLRGKTVGRRLKDQKEKKKQETRTRNAQIHAAVSVAGVAAAVAALAATNAMAIEMAGNDDNDQGATPPTKSAVAIASASASALVASHCIEMAEDIGADYNQITNAVNSAINARTNGDIMALTASAATALRGATILRARLHKNYGTATMFCAANETRHGKEFYTLTALNFVSRGEDLLKRTRKGDLHWKQVSFNINSNWQVVVEMKSKHVGGTFTKKKKCVVYGIRRDIPEWPERGRTENDAEQRKAYFGIKTIERVIEFECGSKNEKQMWIKGIQQLLNTLENIA